jgi:hypothetical protein
MDENLGAERLSFAAQARAAVQGDTVIADAPVILSVSSPALCALAHWAGDPVLRDISD